MDLPKVVAKPEEKLDLPVVVVAGGAGFIGSFLCGELLTKNLRVICVDSLKTGRRENIAHFFSLPGFQFIEHDITQNLPPDIPPAEYIFDLTGTGDKKNLSDFADRFGAKLVVTAALGQNFSHLPSSAVVVRLADIFGPGMRFNDGQILSRLAGEILEGDKVRLPGDGLVELRPTFISDAVAALLKAMFRPDTNGKTFTVVNPIGVTALSFVHKFQELFPVGKQLNFTDLRETNAPTNISWEASRTKDELGWQPEVDYETGIKKLWENRSKRVTAEDKNADTPVTVKTGPDNDQKVAALAVLPPGKEKRKY